MSVTFTGARLIDTNQGIDWIGWVTVQDDRIIALGREQDRIVDPENVVDCHGLIISPGFCDTHVHFRDPGQTHKETLETGCEAAAKGGYTAVVTMANTVPPIDNPSQIEQIYLRRPQLVANLYPVATVTKGLQGKELTDFKAFKELGLTCLSDDGFPIKDDKVARHAFEEAAQYDLRISIHPEHPHWGGDRSIHKGELSHSLGLEGVDPRAEEEHIERDLLLAEECGAKIMVQHVSTAKGVQAIREAKARGVRVTAEGTPHHICFTVDDVERLGTLGKMSPPLRTESDRRAVMEGLLDGTLDCLATDHAPHSNDEKSKGLGEAPNGVIGLESALAAVATKLDQEGKLDWKKLIHSLTTAPRQALSLPEVGLFVGSIADLTFIDPLERWIMSESDLGSKSRNCPWLGQELKGRVKGTMLAGTFTFGGV